ncbi:MAG: VWA domain-containing protein [Gammaproteobacteria bacterium]|nr:VWA domain-containing protein [Gammaproteobacteria bacterium]MYH14601.1 VWA domain-containing protein [Gammaproteobacteria bacterium]MYK83272.1 VWA domain-containing protein [Gammaproteobacteria bacterium]
MDRTLANFIRALRNSEVRISTAETLDAFNAVELVGYRDRAFLKRSLSLVLPKTLDEKETFDACFDQFFSFEDVRREAPGQVRASEQPDAEGATADDSGADGQGEGEGGAGGDRGETAPAGGDQRRGKGKRKSRNALYAEEEEPDLGPGEMSAPTSALGALLMQDSKVELSMAMSQAGEAVDVREIQVFTQKGLYTRRIMDQMGLLELNREIAGAREDPAVPVRRLGQELRRRRDWLRGQVRDYVERQFLLHADASGKRLREELLRKVKLSNVEHRSFRLIQEIVYKMAKRLATMHSRRKKVFKKGQLNVPRTLRHNMAYDGAIFDLRWKSVKIDRPKVFAICDVSGSVANYARFMLMFLYSLEEVMPKVRSFAFSSDLAEVTDLFDRNSIEDAIAKTLRDYGGGSTDYGQAFEDFKRSCLDDVDNRTTIIILGDARNNYGDPRAEILKEMYDRAKRIIWLNPEARNAWTVGDAEMRRYSAYCHQVEECNSLMHLERVVGNLLKTVQ